MLSLGACSVSQDSFLSLLKGISLNSIEFIKIKQDDPLFKKVLAFRYNKYCVEHDFEKKEDFPDGLETDSYDRYSIHFAAIAKSTQKIVGTVRLILGSEVKLPAECCFDLNGDFSTKKMNVGEVSRFAITKKHDIVCQEKTRILRHFSTSNVVDGLLNCLARECIEQNISHLYAVMSRGLPVLLARKKIFYTQVGSPKEYHGLRAPYFVAVDDILKTNPNLFMDVATRSRVDNVA